MRITLSKIIVGSGVEIAAEEKIEEVSSQEEDSARQRRTRQKFCTRYTNQACAELVSRSRLFKPVFFKPKRLFH